MLSKETLDALAEMMYLQERLDELRKGSQQTYYDNKTTPIDNDRGMYPHLTDAEYRYMKRYGVIPITVG